MPPDQISGEPMPPVPETRSNDEPGGPADGTNEQSSMPLDPVEGPKGWHDGNVARTTENLNGLRGKGLV